MCTALRLFSTQKLTVRQNVMQKRASVFRTLSHFYTEKKNHDYYLLFKYWLFMAFESSHEPRGEKRPWLM